MVRTFIAYPTTKPEYIFAGATDSMSSNRNSEHDSLDAVVDQFRQQPGVTLLNDNANGEKTARSAQDAYVIVRCEVLECPELCCYRYARPDQDPEKAIYDLFRRFRQLNAMRSTRGQILVEFPEALVKALCRWPHEEQWRCTSVCKAANLKETLIAMSQEREKQIASLDRNFSGEYPHDARRPFPPCDPAQNQRSLCLLRWLKDLHVLSLSELNESERQRGSVPVPLPQTGFIAVLISRTTGREKIVSAHSNDPTDTTHITRLARSFTPRTIDEDRWEKEYYLTQPIYCTDLNSARILASTQPFLAANWDHFYGVLRDRALCISRE